MTESTISLAEQAEPSRLSVQAIAQYAELVGQHHSIFDETTVADVKGLVNKLGGTIQVSSSFIAPEALIVREPKDFTIFLPPMTPERRDRFTIAHELGHYFLHYLEPRRTDRVTFGRGARNKAETQANLFAASLLMPSELFTIRFSEQQGDMLALARDFEVSPRAAEVRSQVLGLC